MQPSSVVPKAMSPLWLAVAVAAGAFTVGGVGGYSLYEHRMVQTAKAEQQQVTAQLDQARTQIDQLTSKVNALEARPEPQPAPLPVPAVEPAAVAKPAAKRGPSDSQRLKKMQSQLDQQGKAIDQQGKDIATTQSQLDSTRGDLNTTRTELTGSIARTHDELVVLQKKGERNYYEFDILKSKQFQHEGPLGVRLRKANTKHQYADLDLIVEDRTVSQKHVNLYQPAMFFTPDSTQPAELVINSITNDHIHGYVSAPKYRKSELASAQSTSSTGANQTTESQTQAQPQRPTLPQPR